MHHYAENYTGNRIGKQKCKMMPSQVGTFFSYCDRFFPVSVIRVTIFRAPIFLNSNFSELKLFEASIPSSSNSFKLISIQISNNICLNFCRCIFNCPLVLFVDIDILWLHFCRKGVKERFISLKYSELQWKFIQVCE